MRRVRMVASGHVQGVFFRASARDRAAELGLTGWIRNTADGDVEAEAQGRQDSVEAFVDYCRAGPGRARVDALTVTDLPMADDESVFEVRQ